MTQWNASGSVRDCTEQWIAHEIVNNSCSVLSVSSVVDSPVFIQPGLGRGMVPRPSSLVSLILN
jgi:hypothetical protein